MRMLAVVWTAERAITVTAALLCADTPTSSFGTPSHHAFARSLEDLGDSVVYPAGGALSPPPGSGVSAALFYQEPNRKARLRRL